MPLPYLVKLLGAHTVVHKLCCHGPLGKYAIKCFCRLSVWSRVLIYMQHHFHSSQISGGQCSKNKIQHNCLNNAGTPHFFKLYIACAGCLKKHRHVITDELYPQSCHGRTTIFFPFKWKVVFFFSVSYFISHFEYICHCNNIWIARKQLSHTLLWPQVRLDRVRRYSACNRTLDNTKE